MTYDLEKKYNKEVVVQMMDAFGYKNKMAVPKIEKVAVNTGIGSVKDSAMKELIEKNLSIITGQKPKKTLAKKSIASFKIRQGVHIGFSVTLRGKKMYEFLNKMIFVAIPRKRDFRGLNHKCVDDMGNMTIGFKEHLVFPEMAGGDIKNTFGFEVTIITTSKKKKEAFELFKLMGFPFSKK